MEISSLFTFHCCEMADEGRLTEQHIKTVFFSETKSVSSAATKTVLLVNSNIWWPLLFLTIKKINKIFYSDGSVLESKRTQPANVRTPEKVETVRAAL